MHCRSCGAEIAAGASSCARCVTSPHCSPTATRIFQEQDLGKTVVFNPQTVAKPIYGWLVVTEGPDTWHAFQIAREDGQLLLGIGEDCQIKLHDEQLSKRHASIRLQDDKLTIADLDTVTGTSVNQTAITKVDLHDGDEITAGNTTLKFRRL